jgi:translation initiation factor 2A
VKPADLRSVHLLPSSAASSISSRTLPAYAVFALKFSPLSKTLFTFERPGKTDGTEVHKNVRAWTVENGEEITGWHQKTQDDW